MKRNEIWQEVNYRYKQDKKENPSWPDHVCAQAGMVTAQAGLLAIAANDFKYSNDMSELEKEIFHNDMQDSAINVIIKAVRFLEKLQPFVRKQLQLQTISELELMEG